MCDLLVAALVALVLVGIAVACILARYRARTRHPPQLDAETREILDNWTED